MTTNVYIAEAKFEFPPKQRWSYGARFEKYLDNLTGLDVLSLLTLALLRKLDGKDWECVFWFRETF